MNGPLPDALPEVIRVSRDEQHGQARVARLNLQGELEPGNIGETQVQNYQIRACQAENLPGFVGGSSRDGGVTRVLQGLASMAADGGFVFDHEDEGHDQTYTGREADASWSGRRHLRSA